MKWATESLEHVVTLVMPDKTAGGCLWRESEPEDWVAYEERLLEDGTLSRQGAEG